MANWNTRDKCPKCGKFRPRDCLNCGSGDIYFAGMNCHKLMECRTCGSQWNIIKCSCGCSYNIFEQPDANVGGCYITSAVCTSLNKPDDCYELNLLRQFRDDCLKNEADGQKLIDEYYNTAPSIVQKINLKENSSEILQDIYIEYISPCIGLIEKNEYLNCKNMYCKMVRDLQQKMSEND